MTLNIQELQESLKQYTDQKLNNCKNNNSATNTMNALNHTGQNNNIVNNKPKKIINKKIIVESKTKEEVQIENSKKNTINVTQNEIKKDDYAIEKEVTKGGFFEIPTNKKREFDENEFDDDSVEKLIVNTDEDHKEEKFLSKDEIKQNDENFNKNKTVVDNTTDMKLSNMQGKLFLKIDF
jgi:hypothetical protein